MIKRLAAGIYGARLRPAMPSMREVARLVALAEQEAGARQSTGSESSLFGLNDPMAIAWASDHAAELLVMDSAGAQITPRSRLNVASAVVSWFRANAPGKELAENLTQLGFGPSEATTIAMVEIALAQGVSSLVGAMSVGMKLKRWLVSNDPGICEGCAANERQGWISIEEAFASGAMCAIDHVGCRCDVAYRRWHR